MYITYGRLESLVESPILQNNLKRIFFDNLGQFQVLATMLASKRTRVASKTKFLSPCDSMNGPDPSEITKQNSNVCNLLLYISISRVFLPA